MAYIDSSILGPEKTGYVEGLASRMKELMSPSLFRHSLGTLVFALDMASAAPEEVDLYRLAVSCIVHDYGKIFDIETLKKAARENKPELSRQEPDLEPVLHSLAGDCLVSRDLEIKDEKILRAVRVHTIGAVDMTLEEKILFVADKVEKTRKYKGAGHLRKLALKDINLCLIEVYKNTIIYVINKNRLLHPDTSRIWNSICGGN